MRNLILAFTTDNNGNIQDIIFDSESLVKDNLENNKPFISIFDKNSVEKASNFFYTVKFKKFAYGWNLNIDLNENIVILYFSGISFEDKNVILASKSNDKSYDNVDLKSYELKEKELYNELAKTNNELTNMQRELYKNNHELALLNEQKLEFLGMAAHDLRNPLTAIIGYSQFLYDDGANKLPEQYLKFLSIIKSSAKFMVRLIDDLLDISKIEAGKVELDLTEGNIIEIIQSSVYINNFIAKKKQMKIEFDSEESELWLKVDEEKFHQIMNNLISNAIKYSFFNTLINVKVSLNQDFVDISVKDQGQGIPEDEINKIFKPFERTTRKVTGGEHSTGLGLAIVKKLVEAHKGKISVFSKVGEGSEFIVSLPLTN